MTTAKVQSTHCERIAFVYVRQSTWLQVKENCESTERQYNLRERAIELGWPSSRVEVIDEDQGRSGSTAVYRTGFQRLAAEVVLGKVGMVLMLEASRLARNNSDWYRREPMSSNPCECIENLRYQPQCNRIRSDRQCRC